MMTLTVLTAFFAIGFMVNSAIKMSRRALSRVEPVAEPATQMGR